MQNQKMENKEDSDIWTQYWSEMRIFLLSGRAHAIRTIQVYKVHLCSLVPVPFFY